MAIGKNGVVARQLRTLFNVGAIRELTDGQLLERFATGSGEAAELAFAVCWSGMGRWCCGSAGACWSTCTTPRMPFRRRSWCWSKRRADSGCKIHWVPGCIRWLTGRRRAPGRPPPVAAGVRRVRRRLCPGRAAPRLMPSWGECSTRKSRGSPSGSGRRWCFATSRGARTIRRRGIWAGQLERSRAGSRGGGNGFVTGSGGRGLAPDIGLLAAAPRFEQAGVSVPSALVDATTSAAVHFAAGGSIVSGSATFLAQGVLRSMCLIPWLKVATAVLVLGTTTLGVDLLVQRGPSRRAGPVPSAREAARVDEVPVYTVEPGNLRLTVVAKGVVEASRSEFVFCRVRGARPSNLSCPRGQESSRVSLWANSTR